MEIRTFTLGENYRISLDELFSQLSGKSRELNLEQPINVWCIGAFDGNRLVGFAQLFILQKTTFTIGYLEDLILLEEYRGKGWGKVILDKVIKTAKEQDCANITLTSRPERIEAMKLFQSMGFVQPGNQVLRLTLMD